MMVFACSRNNSSPSVLIDHVLERRLKVSQSAVILSLGCPHKSHDYGSGHVPAEDLAVALVVPQMWPYGS